MSTVKFSLISFLIAYQSQYAFSFDHCFDLYGKEFRISPDLLRAIAITESNMNPKAENIATKDRGLMQINPWWFPKLQVIGIDPESLWNPCVSIKAGSWILSQEISRYGYSWTAVGAYHAGAYTSRTLIRKQDIYINYARKVKKNLGRL